jgi:hypothetical protein
MNNPVETHNQEAMEQVFNSLGRKQVFLSEFVDKVMISIRDDDVSTWQLEAIRGRNMLMIKQSVKRLLKRSPVLEIVPARKAGMSVVRRVN